MTPDSGKTFREAAARFEQEYEVITLGERSPAHIKRLKSIIEIHLMQFFGKMPLTAITSGVVQDYRVHRHSKPRPRPGQQPEDAKPPSRSTLHQEIIALRHVLKTGERHGWIPATPSLSPPYKASGKVTHRAWF